jgi:hypothetical protein
MGDRTEYEGATLLVLHAASGRRDNNRVDDSKLPADFSIDYVRIWERKDLSSGVNGTEKPDLPMLRKQDP